MLTNQILVELKRYLYDRNFYISLVIIFVLPALSLYYVKSGYYYPTPIHAFQNALSLIIPMLFPALIVLFYLPSFLQEQNSNFIFFTRSRIYLDTYILSKSIANAIITGLFTFLMVFLLFLYIVYIDPIFGLIDYTQDTVVLSDLGEQGVMTFDHLIAYGDIIYVTFYSLWVAINGMVYSSISFFLMLIIRTKFIALSIPFLFYHIFNFIVGILGVAKFSPLSTIFPFNIEEQPFWTVIVPFTLLLICLLVLINFANRHRENWVE